MMLIIFFCLLFARFFFTIVMHIHITFSLDVQLPISMLCVDWTTSGCFFVFVFVYCCLLLLYTQSVISVKLNGHSHYSQAIRYLQKTNLKQLHEI
jgi:hypothetical protein